MGTRKLEAFLSDFFIWTNPLNYFYATGVIFGALFQDIGKGIKLFTKDMERGKR